MPEASAALNHWRDPGGLSLAWVSVKLNGSVWRIPLLFQGNTIEWSVFEYMTSDAVLTLSTASLKHRGAAILRLYQYYMAFGRPVLGEGTAKDLYRDFGRALTRGTVIDGQDPLGLYWPAMRTKSARIVASAVREFSNHLRDNYGGPEINPLMSPETSSLAFAYRRHLEIAKGNSVFAHLKNIKADLKIPRIPQHDTLGKPGRTGGSQKSAPKPFPEELLLEFFRNGMKRARRVNPISESLSASYNIRDFLYFMLLAFGGLRSVEPLHLFIEDIQPDSEAGCAIWLFHPEDGAPPQGSLGNMEPRHRPTTRRDYLKRRFGLYPRNAPKMRGTPLFAGWKNLLLEESVPQQGLRSRVYWQNAAIGAVFWKLHSIYMDIRPSTKDRHPYYFVSLDPATYGEPWKEASSKDAFNAALRRMGLSPSSALGLCRHGLRHRLGYRLVKLGIAPSILQIILHHQNPASQEVYTRMTPADINEALKRAHAKREIGDGNFDASDLGLNWKSDPFKLFEGPSEKLLKKLTRK